MRHAVAVFLCVAGSFAAPARAQSLTLTAQQSAAIDAVFAKQKITAQSPGCGLALIRRGSIEQFRGYGLADVENGIAWTPRTVFHTGSIFKQFYAAAVVMLGRQGKLSLDDDVRKYVPELPDYGARITVRNVLTHTHGLRERDALEDLTPPRSGNADFLRLLVRQKAPSDPPGARLRYGNTGPFLAGRIIDRVSGLSKAEFIGRNILAPFGMASTSFGEESRVLPPLTPAYISQTDGSFKRREGGTFRTTLDDLARWDGQFDRGDDDWKSVLQVMLTPATLRDGTAVDMGMGLRLRPYRGLRRVWAPGGAPGFRAMFMRFPDAGMTIALGCNRDDVEPVKMAEEIADVVLADAIHGADRRDTPHVARISKRVARALAGTYVGDGYAVRVVERSGRLFMVSDKGEFEMTPSGPDRFVFADRAVILRDGAVDAQFRTDPTGARRLQLRTVWDPAEFVRVQPADAHSIRLDDYVGTFTSDELQSELVITRSGDRVLLKAPRGEFSLEPLSADLFRTSGPSTGYSGFVAGSFILRFRRSGGVVDAVSVSRATLTGIMFVRTPGQTPGR